jgi:hypothetical protein
LYESQTAVTAITTVPIAITTIRAICNLIISDGSPITSKRWSQ